MHRSALWLTLISCLTLGGIIFLTLQQEGGTVFEQKNQENKLESTKEDPSEETITPTSASPSFVEILPIDCTNECAAFETSPDQYVYCQNVCGLSPDPATSTPTLTDPNLSKDLEQKDTAIKEGNLSGCDTITDSTLRKTCQVRVTEDLLE